MILETEKLLTLVASPQRNIDDVNQLLISTHTVDSHREHIKQKLDLPSAGELSRAAVQWVLENP